MTISDLADEAHEPAPVVRAAAVDPSATTAHGGDGTPPGMDGHERVDGDR